MEEEKANQDLNFAGNLNKQCKKLIINYQKLKKNNKNLH